MSTSDRQSKAKELRAQHKVHIIRKGVYRVKSHYGKGHYVVIKVGRKWMCSCPDYKYRRVQCKHILAVESVVPRQLQETITTSIQRLHNNGCIYCNSKNIKKDGIRKNKCGPTQIFQCNDCSKYFTLNPGFERMRSKPELITHAMTLYFSGLSLRSTSRAIIQLGFAVTHQTIYNWIKKYVALMEKYLADVTPDVSDAWRSDELYVKFNGRMKFLFSMIDDDTRYWIARQVSDYKNASDVRPMFRSAMEVAHKRPAAIITDGGRHFQTAFQKEYFVQKGPKTRHFSHAHIRGDYTNNKMERFNGELRDREKVMRGLKTMDTPVIPGCQIFHNHVRPHTGLDSNTPGEKCGITIEGQNKWITLIQNASQKQTKLHYYPSEQEEEKKIHIRYKFKGDPEPTDINCTEEQYKNLKYLPLMDLCEKADDNLDAKINHVS